MNGTMKCATQEVLPNEPDADNKNGKIKINKQVGKSQGDIAQTIILMQRDRLITAMQSCSKSFH
jgi:hypothetical protein